MLTKKRTTWYINVDYGFRHTSGSRSTTETLDEVTGKKRLAESLLSEHASALRDGYKRIWISTRPIKGWKS